MITKAYDSNGKLWNIKCFRSRADAHQRQYYDECKVAMTPCMYSRESGRQSYFRYVGQSGKGGRSNGMSIEHRVTQERLQYYFQKGWDFNVVYWDRVGDNKLKRMEVNLTKYYDECEMEGAIGNRVADILLKSRHNNVPPIMIEVWHGHYCEQDKLDEGHLIIEFRIKEIEDIQELVRNWGLKEAKLNETVPTVRFYNFRERRFELPWI